MTNKDHNSRGRDASSRLSWRCAALLLGSTLALSACGGGDGDDGDPSGSGDTGSSSQQYPAGVWSGTSAGQNFFGIIDPGATGVSGTGGFFYFARGGVDETGYDGLYGNVTTTGARATATNSVYYTRPADSSGTGTFTTGISLSGTLSGRSAAGWSSSNGAFTGNYTSPSNSASRLAFSLTYDSNLSSVDSSLDIADTWSSNKGGIQGAYTGSSTDGAGWGLYIDWAGRVSGRSANCQIYGEVTPRSTSTSTNPFYVVTLRLSPAFNATTTSTCAQPEATLEGRAIVRYSNDGAKEGIWLVARNSGSSRNAMIFDGSYLPASSNSTVTTPRTYDVGTASITSQSAAGSWTGTDVFNGEQVNAVVLSNGEYFIYSKNGQGDVLYNPAVSGIGVASGSSRFYSDNGIFWRRSSDTLYTGVHLAGDVKTRATLKALHDDPSNQSTNSGLPSAFSLTADTARSFTIAAVAGKTYTNQVTASFGGLPLVRSVTIADTPSTDGSYAFTGTASGSCTVSGTIWPTAENGNMFAVDTLAYAGTACSLDGTSQKGVLVVDSNSSARLLTAATNAFTIFIGTQQ